MTEQEHLECEIKEYQIELQRHEEAIERLKVRIEKKKKELLKTAEWIKADDYKEWIEPEEEQE
jgi:alpha-amylase/alpha-mannosidase (GH57 family)